jgi:ZIP family zinc transporter
MIHNLPEGMAVAMPIYVATQNKWYSVKVAAFSGIFEPLGVLLVGLIFGDSISPYLLHALFGSGM